MEFLTTEVCYWHEVYINSRIQPATQRLLRLLFKCELQIGVWRVSRFISRTVTCSCRQQVKSVSTWREDATHSSQASWPDVGYASNHLNAYGVEATTPSVDLQPAPGDPPQMSHHSGRFPSPWIPAACRPTISALADPAGREPEGSEKRCRSRT